MEYEATRKQNFESHLPLKKPKTPPWQQKLDVSRMIAQRKVSRRLGLGMVSLWFQCCYCEATFE